MYDMSTLVKQNYLANVYQLGYITDVYTYVS